MSLLLDALKRAEQEKLARRGSEPPAEQPDEAEPAQVPAARRRLELESQPVARETPAPAATPSAGAATARDRESAKAVFAAKQVELPRGRASGKNKAMLAIGLGAIALLVAGGGYVWYELNAIPGPLARVPAPIAPPRPIAPASLAALQPGAVVAASSTPASGSAASGTPGSTVAPEAAVAPVAALQPEKPAAESTKPKPKAAERLVMSLLKEPANAKSRPPLKLARTIDAPRVSIDVRHGYDALKRGDAAAARKYYEAAVAADATNLDAQLGLATAAARTGDRESAARHYRRTLALDPRNPSAIAGLAALVDLTRPEGLEEGLRAEITRYPQSPALHFTLGNLYASQRRWTEAQAAYFEAYRLDPESADLAYNLAVSLDHLGQAKLAADFYRRALAAAGQQSAQFETGHVTRRIAELQH